MTSPTPHAHYRSSRRTDHHPRPTIPRELYRPGPWAVPPAFATSEDPIPQRPQNSSSKVTPTVAASYPW
ncbi:hypothetical protein BU23DRAFT_555835 [Bimuria novae-zelandiae CBS 107.79]|uniref:Uncharacterized protein n=1 Tax=Bimuria novae-zelandiae CBS 107.79 TaxID=1447943 RepID=A0A6A5V326_9PLEO|nr:hypothetical protein BU23DRAFT_555835 [Bimuria novae-zelandiae CBS 107.79]